MSTPVSWPPIGGSPYSIPATGELNWQALSSFLIALGNKAQSIDNTKLAIRTATTSPVTVATASDTVIVCQLTVPAAVTVNLPAGITGQTYVVVDGTGDASSNNITIVPNGAEQINGASSYVINKDRAGVLFAFNGVSWTICAEYTNIASGTIPRSSIAPGTPNQVVINDGSGNLSSEAQLAKSRGGTGADNTNVTFPSTGVVVTEAGTETLTNKTIDGDDNTVQDLGIGSLKTVIGNASKFLSFDGSGAPVATKAVPTGVVLGTTDTQTVSGKTLVDNSTTFQDETDATKQFQFQASGITTGNTRVYTMPDGTTTLLATDVQAAVTNKDIDGGTAANNHRITIPSATKATLDGLTRKAGTIVYATDTKLTYMDNGTTLVPIGSGGTGVKNYVLNPNDATQGWASSNGSNVAVSTETTAANLPDNVTQTTAIKILRASGTTDYIRYRFTLDQADYSKLVQIVWDQIYAGTSGDYQVQIWSNTASNYGGSYTQITTPVTNIPGLYTGTFNTVFATPASGNQYLELRIVAAAGTTPLYLNNVTVTPGQLLQGAAISGPLTQAFTIAGSTSAPTPGSGATLNVTWYRDGCFMCAQYEFNQANAGSAGSGTYKFPVPNNLNIDLTGFPNVQSDGWAAVGTGVAFGGSASFQIDAGIFDSRYFYLRNFNDTTAFATVNSSNLALSNAAIRYSFQVRVPIAEWAGNGTVNLGQGAQVEYAYNSSTSTTTSDTTSFAYGPTGALIQSITSTLSRTVRFQYPIQPTDLIVVEVQQDTAGAPWLEVGNMCPGNVSINRVVQNSNTYGIGILLDSGNPTTQVVVNFAQYSYPNGTTYGAAGQSWSGAGFNTYRWRVRKCSPSAPVGFGLVTSSSSGLMASSPTLLSDSIATILGQKQYFHGGSYNGGGAPTITLASGGGTLSSVIRGLFIPYQLQDGTWRLRATATISVSSVGRTSAVFSINGVTFKALASYLQTCSSIANSGNIPTVAYAVQNTGNIDIEQPSGSATTTSYSFSGDFELDSKPTWAY